MSAVLSIQSLPFSGGYAIMLDGRIVGVTQASMVDALGVALQVVRRERGPVVAAPLCRDFQVSTWLNCEHLGSTRLRSRRAAYALALATALDLAKHADDGLEGAVYVEANGRPAHGYAFEADGTGASVEPVDWA